MTATFLAHKSAILLPSIPRWLDTHINDNDKIKYHCSVAFILKDYPNARYFSAYAIEREKSLEEMRVKHMVLEFILLCYLRSFIVCQTSTLSRSQESFFQQGQGNITTTYTLNEPGQKQNVISLTHFIPTKLYKREKLFLFTLK